MTIETPRLRLRPFIDADIEPWVAMLTDPDVMEYVAPAPVSAEIAAAAFTHYRALLPNKGYGWWAIDVKDGASFAGVILLQDVGFSAAFTPAIEVGWDLLPRHWGNGYATEGGRAALDFAFSVLGVDEVVALTAAGNVRSQRVMARLGMTHDPADDFDHPHLPHSPLRHCVLHRMKRPARGGDERMVTAPE